MSLLKKHSGGKFLSSEDFPQERVWKETGVVLTISDFTEDNVARQDQPPEVKLIVHFEDSKPLVANKTNANMITGLFGVDESKVVGQKIGLYVDPEVKNKGKIVRGLRLCDHRETGDQFSDDIPF